MGNCFARWQEYSTQVLYTGTFIRIAVPFSIQFFFAAKRTKFSTKFSIPTEFKLSRDASTKFTTAVLNLVQY